MTTPVSRRDRRPGRGVLQTRWRRLSVVFALAALVCVAVAAIPSSGGGSGGTPTALPTPLWSARRAPELVVDGVGAQRLQASLTADLAADPGSCFVVSEGAEPLAALNPTAPLLPASTEKLLTATAALVVLGPNFRYETKAVADQAPDSSGTLDRLWLVGSVR